MIGLVMAQFGRTRRVFFAQVDYDPPLRQLRSDNLRAPRLDQTQADALYAAIAALPENGRQIDG